MLVHTMEPPPAPAAAGPADPAAARAAQLGAAATAGACAARLGARELLLWQPCASFLLSPAAQDLAYPEQMAG